MHITCYMDIQSQEIIFRPCSPKVQTGKPILIKKLTRLISGKLSPDEWLDSIIRCSKQVSGIDSSWEIGYPTTGNHGKQWVNEAY